MQTALYNIQELRKEFELYMQENPFAQQQPKELYEPLDYILSIGGKRMRPILLMMAYNLYQSNLEECLPAAYAVEVFHNFTLMHDDIMDDANLRRGKASVHCKYDTNTAILSGDVMLLYAYEYLRKSNVQLFGQTFPIFNQVAIEVCEGQQMDINFEQRQDVSIPEYIRMIELKTSVLLYGAMKIGALLGGASEEDADLLGEFGRNMGIAFQIQDDLLDSFGEHAKVGKRIGGDILQNKKTYLVLKALENGSESDIASLNNWLSQTVSKDQEEEKIEAVKAIFQRTGVLEAIDQSIQHYSNQAKKYLEQVQIEPEKKQALLEFLNYIMKREY